MLQNRVGPSGEIIFTPARGAFTGTRGVLHNEQQIIIRPFKLKAWLTCLLEFKGRKRKVMSPERYTELFFLDEATAFAAGHRPCAECRRSDFNRFKTFWIKGNPAYGFDQKTSIHKIDDVLHNERIAKDNSKITFEQNPASLPDGTFVVFENQRYLLDSKKLHRWTPFGYTATMDVPVTNSLTILTPVSIVKTFAAGYKPQYLNT